MVASALEAIRKSILSGRLFSGQRLVEATLASELGISRGPLREALTILQRDGLVVEIPRRGRFVLVFTERAVEEFYDLRGVLESYAVELVIQTLDPAKLDILRRQADLVSSAEENDEGPNVVTADLDFHGLLYELADRQLLHRLWLDNMAGKLQFLDHLTVPDEYEPQSRASNHTLIVDAIERRDITAARRLVVEHIEDALQRARRAVAQQGDLREPSA